jgi:spore coat polysaccharide biosynthesis protein SpsF (cytidylyltransferase family)
MIEIEKLKKAHVIPRRMYLIKHMCEGAGIDIDYLFGLFNMYNTKNRGRWFWQKATFTAVLKDDFDRFNSYMDKFTQKLKSFNEDRIWASINEAQDLLNRLVKNLEISLFVNREDDEVSVKLYNDENIKSLIRESLKGF